MNKIHRTLWNEARGCYIVAHEKAATHGKPSSTKKTVVQAIGAALLALGSAGALAGTSGCGTPDGLGLITITRDTSLSNPNAGCLLLSNQALIVEGPSNGQPAGFVVGGTVAGGTGIYIGEAQKAVSITNYGTIAAVGIISGSTIAGGGIWMNHSSLTGSIENHASFSDEGTLNGGIISGGQYGVYLGPKIISDVVKNGGGSTIGGSIQNEALIAGGEAGIVLNKKSVILGGVNNYINADTPGATGTIAGGRGGLVVESHSSISGGVVNEGHILASNIGTGGGGVGIYVGTNSGISGGINNSGTASSIIGSTFSILPGGTIQGGYGIDVTNAANVSGGINNAGTIIGSISGGLGLGTYTGGIGINVENGSRVSDGITNSGLILGDVGSLSGSVTGGVGINVIGGSSVVGDIRNTGNIGGSTIGINIGRLDSQYIQTGTSSGGIVSNPSLVSGDIINSGSVTGGHIGINVNTYSAVLGAIKNLGTASSIIGGDTGISIHTGSSVGGGIKNQGLISGQLTGLAVWKTSNVAGGVTNSGLIRGGNTAVFVGDNSSITGGITNSGLIEASGGTTLSGGIGISVVNASTVTQGITNWGAPISNAPAGPVIGNQPVSGVAQIRGESNSALNGTLGGAYGVGINLASNSSLSGGILSNGFITGNSTSSVNGSISDALSLGVGVNVIESSVLTGSISNSGSISGSSHVTNGVEGSVSGTLYSGIGINVAHNSSAEEITNKGDVKALLFQGSNGGPVFGLNGTASGSVASIQGISTASLSGSLSGAFGVGINVANASSLGSVDNNGIISGQSHASLSGMIGTTSGTLSLGVGINVLEGSTLNGNITNDLGIIAGRSDGTITGSVTGALYAGIGINLIGTTAFNGNISNSGLISGNTSGLISGNTSGATINGGIGINVANASFGNIVNADGIISGVSEGSVTGSGSSNLQGGIGINLLEATMSGGITNSGLISGNASGDFGGNPQYALLLPSGVGIELLATTVAGGIHNDGTASGIVGTLYGIKTLLSTVSGGLHNEGTIAGSITGVATWISSISGGINNSDTGTVVGGFIGISSLASTVSGGINNSGTIEGGLIGLSSVISSISGGINNTGGTIHGAMGILALNDRLSEGGITNSGSIVGENASNLGASFLNVGILASNTSITGNIDNSGLILGHSQGTNSGGFGIALLGGQNSIGSGIGSLIGGLLSGLPVSPEAYAPVLDGSITNSGIISGLNDNTVSGGGVGIGVNAYTITGDISNSALIQGIDNGTIGGSSIAGVGIAVDLSTIGGSITNSGSILGQTSQTVSGGGGIGIEVGYSTVVGGISNSGLIQGFNTGSGTIYGGIGIALDASAMGQGITNSGLIQGSLTGVKMNASTIGGDIFNQGNIIADRSSTHGERIALGNGIGVYLDVSTVSGKLFNDQGSIIGANVGVGAIDHSTIVGGVTNSGLIQGGFVGIMVTDASTVSGGGIQNLSSGTIQGALAGIAVAGYNGTVTGVAGSFITGGISNAGHISGVGAGSFSGAVGIGVLSHSSVAGGINNSGVISGAAKSGTPVLGASIAQGDGLGIYLNQSQVSDGISNSGQIIGGNVGIGEINFSTIAGGITNSGSASVVEGRFVGIAASDGSSITGGIHNLNGGIIQGTSLAGIAVAAFSGTTASGMPSSVSGGIENLGTTSAIQGGMIGIGIISGSSVSGGITNQGTILGAVGAGILIGEKYSDTSLTSTGTVSSLDGWIRNTGVIGGGYVGIGIDNGVIHGSVSNSGLIQGGALGIGLTHAGDITGDIINTSSGLITAGSVGIALESSTVGGNITNSGYSTIFGGQNGIGIAASTVGGSITNSDNSTISGGNDGIALATSTIGGSITNGYSTISGGVDGIHLSASTIGGSISNTAGIIAGEQYGITVSGSTIHADITNTGVIQGVTKSGLALSQSTIGGNIANSGSGRIEGGQYAIKAANSTIGGDIANSDNSTLSGGISGISLASTTIGGSITNDGDSTIVGGSVSGVAISAGSSIGGGIGNSAGSIIAGGNYGISVGGSIIHTDIANSGLIQGVTSSGIALSNSTVGGSITNSDSGRIEGGHYGVGITDSTLSGSLLNAGVIMGTHAGIFVDPSYIGGNITNSGTIVGNAFGLLVSQSTVAGYIGNTGVISGATATGIAIALDNQSTLVGGILNSSPGSIIQGGQTGISVTDYSTISGVISNTGLISGSKYAIYVDPDTSSASTIRILGSNTATFAGDVLSRNSDVHVGYGEDSSTFTGTNAFDVKSFTVESGSLFNMGVMGTASGSIVANPGVTVQNGFTNSGTLSILPLDLDLNQRATITGSYTQTDNAVFRMGVLSGNNLNNVPQYRDLFGRLIVSGAVTLPAITNIDVVVDSRTNQDPHYALVNGDILKGVIQGSTVTGANSFVVTDNKADITFTGYIDATGGTAGKWVDLNVSIPNALYTPDLNGVQNKVGTGASTVLDNVQLGRQSGGTTGLDDVLRELNALHNQDGGQQKVTNAVKTLLPLFTGSGTAAVSAALHGVNRIIQARQEGNHGQSSGDAFAGDKYVWGKAFTSKADQNDQGDVSGFKANTNGLIFGTDAELSGTNRIGGAFAYSRSDITGNSSIAVNSGNVSTYQAVVYGSHTLDESTQLNFQGDLGLHRNEGTRQIVIGSDVRTAKADYNSTSLHLGSGLAHTYKVGDQTTLTPSVTVDYTHVTDKGYTETGAGDVNLTVDSRKTSQLIFGVNGKLAHQLSDATSLLANLGVGYDALAKQSEITSAFVGDGAAFTTYGIEPKKVSYSAGLGVSTKASSGMEVTVRYDLEGTSGFKNQSASAKLRWSF